MNSTGSLTSCVSALVDAFGMEPSHSKISILHLLLHLISILLSTHFEKKKSIP